MSVPSFSRIRSIHFDTFPCMSLYAALTPATLSAFIISMTPSASASDSLPLRNARFVNSPFFAMTAP